MPQRRRRRSPSAPVPEIWIPFVAAMLAPIRIPVSLPVPPNELRAKVAVCLWPDPEIVKPIGIWIQNVISQNENEIK